MTESVLLFSDSLPETEKSRLASSYRLLDFSEYSDPTTAPGFGSALAETDGAIGAHMLWPAEIISHAHRLRVLSSVSVGVDYYDIEELTRRGISVGYTPDVLTDATADAAIALLLATARRVPELSNWVRSGSWTEPVTFSQYGLDVHHKHLGVVGMGRIGQAIARRARFGFCMDVSYYNRTRKQSAEAEIGMHRLGLGELLELSDFVCVALPATDETYNLFGAKQFRQMQQHAIFINVARGSVVDEDALISALDAKKIRGAGLDVVKNEPVGPNNPLIGRNDILVLPHIGSATTETRHAMAHLAVDNLIAGLEGLPMPARYNLPAGSAKNTPKDDGKD